MDVLMPQIVAVMQDVAQRCGFTAIYVGISDFGRQWFDRRYPQGEPTEAITKLHSDELGFRYYFDSFRLAGRGTARRRWEYMPRRTLAVRAYAVVFGLVELSKGNRAKCKAFFDSARNLNNCWQVPVNPAFPR